MSERSGTTGKMCDINLWSSVCFTVLCDDGKYLVSSSSDMIGLRDWYLEQAPNLTTKCSLAFVLPPPSPTLPRLLSQEDVGNKGIFR